MAKRDRQALDCRLEDKVINPLDHTVYHHKLPRDWKLLMDGQKADDVAPIVKSVMGYHELTPACAIFVEAFASKIFFVFYSLFFSSKQATLNLTSHGIYSQKIEQAAVWVEG